MMTSFKFNHYHVLHDAMCQLSDTEQILKMYEAKIS